MDRRHTRMMEELQIKIHGFTRTLKSNKTAWKARCHALEQLSKILVQGLSHEEISMRREFAVVFIPMTEQFSTIFETQITDLRSEVVKTCAQTICTFARELQLNFLKCVRRLFGPLTDSLRFPNKVIQGHIDDAICSIIRFCPSSAVLLAILTRFEAAKAKTQLKEFCAEYLRLCLASWTFEKFQTDRYASAIEDAILAGFRASVGAIRSTAASSFWLYLDHYPHRESSFRKKLNERDKALVKRGRISSRARKTQGARLRHAAASHSSTSSLSQKHSHQISLPSSSARSQISPASSSSSTSVRSSNSYSRSNLSSKSQKSDGADSFTTSNASARNGNIVTRRSPLAAHKRTMSASSLVDSRNNNKHSVSSSTRARSQSDPMYSLSHSPAAAAHHETRRAASKANVVAPCRRPVAAAAAETSPGILSDADVYSHSLRSSDEHERISVKAFASAGRLWKSVTLPSSSASGPVSARSHSDVFAHTSDAFNVKHTAASSSNRGHSAHQKRSQKVLDDVSHSGYSHKTTPHSSSTLKITKVSRDYPTIVHNANSGSDLNTYAYAGTASSQSTCFEQRSFRASPRKEEQRLEDQVEIENTRAENALRKTEAESIERAKRMLRSRTAQRSPVDDRMNLAHSSVLGVTKGSAPLDAHLYARDPKAAHGSAHSSRHSDFSRYAGGESQEHQRLKTDRSEGGANTTVVQAVLGGSDASAVMNSSLTRTKDALRTYARVPTSSIRTKCDLYGDSSYGKINEASLLKHVKRPDHTSSFGRTANSSPDESPSSASMSVGSYRTSTSSSSGGSTSVSHARMSVDTTKSTNSFHTTGCAQPLYSAHASTRTVGDHGDSMLENVGPLHNHAIPHASGQLEQSVSHTMESHSRKCGSSSRQHRERLATIAEVQSLVDYHKSHISELTAVLEEEKLLLRKQSRNVMSVSDRQTGSATLNGNLDASQYARDMVSLLKRLRLRTDVVLSKFEPFDIAKAKPSY